MRPSILILEDNLDDVALVERELRRHGMDPTFRVEETSAGLSDALRDPAIEIVLSDYHMPRLTAPEALDIIQKSGRDMPLIVVSGSIGESSAVDLLKRGAADFILKDNLARLAPAVDRELREVAVRRERAAADIALREALQVRDDFLSVASHELRTPLTTLQLQLGSLLRTVKTAQLDERIQRRVEISCRSAARLAKLIDRVLDVNRLAAGSLALDPQPGGDLGKLVSESIVELEPILDDAAVEIETSLSPNATGTWDADALKVVVTNLLTNALKYGGRQPIRIVLEATDSAVQLSVIDRGIGISPEDQARIFNRFVRAASKRDYGGFGVGLWQSRELVRMHGGTIRVESAPERGAAFIVDLPREAQR